MFAFVNSFLSSNSVVGLGFFGSQSFVTLVRVLDGRPHGIRACSFSCIVSLSSVPVVHCMFLDVDVGRIRVGPVCLTCLSVEGRGRNFGLHVLLFCLFFEVVVLHFRIVVVISSFSHGRRV